MLAGCLVVLSVGAYVLLRDSESTSTTRCTTYNGTVAEQCAEDYVSLSVEDAANKAKSNKLFPKTIKKDGETQAFTDVGAASIYFEVENKTVVKAYFELNRPQN